MNERDAANVRRVVAACLAAARQKIGGDMAREQRLGVLAVESELIAAFTILDPDFHADKFRLAASWK